LTVSWTVIFEDEFDAEFQGMPIDDMTDIYLVSLQERRVGNYDQESRTDIGCIAN
jgi:hypothetical protein